VQVRKCTSLKGCKRNPQPVNRNVVVTYECQDNGKKKQQQTQTTKPIIYFTQKAQQNTSCIKILISGMNNYAWKKIPLFLAIPALSTDNHCVTPFNFIIF